MDPYAKKMVCVSVITLMTIPIKKWMASCPSMCCWITDAGLVDYEMDFYYTVTEGQDPEYLIEKYRPRFRLCHMRDVLKERLRAGSEEESSCDLGQGIINYRQLLSVALKNGMEYFFVEQSRLFHETAIQSAEVNANYLKKL
jgi:sugar phosphate isomerase/epimerase